MRCSFYGADCTGGGGMHVTAWHNVRCTLADHGAVNLRMIEIDEGAEWEGGRMKGAEWPMIGAATTIAADERDVNFRKWQVDIFVIFARRVDECSPTDWWIRFTRSNASIALPSTSPPFPTVPRFPPPLALPWQRSRDRLHGCMPWLDSTMEVGGFVYDGGGRVCAVEVASMTIITSPCFHIPWLFYEYPEF